MDNKKRFDNIAKDIKSIKIQGARNIAKSALMAYSLIPNKSSIKTLISLRPTEPMLNKVLRLTSKKSNKELLNHFDSAQEGINRAVIKLVKDKEVIFTHCHSTNVINSLIYAKKLGKDFEVYNTETRPLFQGRKTSKELKKVGIKVTLFVDSAIGVALEKENIQDKIYANKVFLGADALLSNGIINKVGSKTISELSYYNKIPVYIIADSWKYSSKKILIENRNLNEVWDHAPKNIKIKTLLRDSKNESDNQCGRLLLLAVG